MTTTDITEQDYYESVWTNRFQFWLGDLCMHDEAFTVRKNPNRLCFDCYCVRCGTVLRRITQLEIMNFNKDRRVYRETEFERAVM